MKIRILGLFVALGALSLGSSLCRADEKAAVGKPAPGFTLPGSDGKTHSLADYKGKTIVLEWTNPGCPFVKKWYGGGAMQSLQKEATAKGTVWIRINSSAPGKEGYETPEQAATTDREQKTAATVTLLDPEGKVGRLYGAKTTPHMYVIDPKGTLDYEGAIDSIRSADAADIPKATNYVTAALADLAAGKAVATPSTQSYGCSVKYAGK
ncbi:MAG: thioredoxin family protein [Chthoniobacteraceae bacterium]